MSKFKPSLRLVRSSDSLVGDDTNYAHKARKKLKKAKRKKRK